jgi:hypothetical protein
MANVAPPTWGDHLRRILADFDDQRVRSDINAMREMVSNLRVIVSRCCEQEAEAGAGAGSLTPRELPPWEGNAARLAGEGNAVMEEQRIPPLPPRPLFGAEKPGCEGITPQDCQAAAARLRWENSQSSRYLQGGGRRRKTRSKKYKSKKTRKGCHGVSGP